MSCTHVHWLQINATKKDMRRKEDISDIYTDPEVIRRFLDRLGDAGYISESIIENDARYIALLEWSGVAITAIELEVDALNESTDIPEEM